MLIKSVAIILRRVPLKEYDERLLFFTQELGKVWIYSFGSRSINSLRGKGLGFLQWMIITIEKKKNQYTLKEISTKEIPSHFLKEDFFLDFSELLKTISEKLPNEVKDSNIYSLVKFFSKNEMAKINKPFRKFAFIFSFLIEMGVVPQFSDCVICKTYCSNFFLFFYPLGCVGEGCYKQATLIEEKIKFSKGIKISLIDIYFLNYYVKDYFRNLQFLQKINRLVNDMENIEKPVSLNWESIWKVLEVIKKNS